MNSSENTNNFSYGAARLFPIACRAAIRSLEVADDSIVAVLFSAATTEALMFDVNDIANLPFPKELVDPRSKAYGALQHELESSHAQLKAKISAYFLCFAPEQLNWGAQPFQDIDLLIDLRNELVHHKPERSSTSAGAHIRSGKPKRLLDRMKSRGLKTDTDSLERWTEVISTHVIAKWACHTVARFALLISGTAPNCMIGASMKGCCGTIPLILKEWDLTI